jgi:hypothetical protein
MSEEVINKEEVKATEPGLYQVFVNGKITGEDLSDVIEQINRLPYGSSLMIWLSSPGGSPQMGLMFDEKIIAKGINATYISQMFNGSTACWLPQLSDSIRLAYFNSVFTFHGATIHASDRKDQFEMLVDYARLALDEIDNRVMKKVGLTKKEYKKYNGDDIVLYGYQLLDIGEHGFIDGLILKEINTGVFLVKTRDGNKIIDVVKHKRSDIKDLPLEK